jgi:hypothetical protein
MSATRRPTRMRLGSSSTTNVTQSSVDRGVSQDESHIGMVTSDDFDFDPRDIEWDLLATGVSPIIGMDSQTFQKDVPHLSFAFLTNDTGIYGADLTDPIIRSPSIPTMPTYSLRSFGQNPALKGGSLTTAMLMIRVLSAYPTMMQNPEALPPFIHFTSLYDHAAQPLMTCMSLMQMVSTGGQGSRRLLWKNVRMECERMQIEVSPQSSVMQ